MIIRQWYLQRPSRWMELGTSVKGFAMAASWLVFRLSLQESLNWQLSLTHHCCADVANGHLLVYAEGGSSKQEAVGELMARHFTLKITTLAPKHSCINLIICRAGLTNRQQKESLLFRGRQWATHLSISAHLAYCQWLGSRRWLSTRKRGALPFPKGKSKLILKFTG
jgi:hypothetical protein